MRAQANAADAVQEAALPLPLPEDVELRGFGPLQAAHASVFAAQVSEWVSEYIRRATDHIHSDERN